MKLLTSKKTVTQSTVSAVYDIYNDSIASKSYHVLPTHVKTRDALTEYLLNFNGGSAIAICIAHDTDNLGNVNILYFCKDGVKLYITRPCFRSMFVFHTNNPELLRELNNITEDKVFSVISTWFLNGVKRYKRAKITPDVNHPSWDSMKHGSTENPVAVVEQEE